MKWEAKQEPNSDRIPPRRLNAVWMINKTPFREISQGRLVKVHSHAHGSSLRAEQFVGTPPARQRKFEKGAGKNEKNQEHRLGYFQLLPTLE